MLLIELYVPWMRVQTSVTIVLLLDTGIPAFCKPGGCKWELAVSTDCLESFQGVSRGKAACSVTQLDVSRKTLSNNLSTKAAK